MRVMDRAPAAKLLLCLSGLISCVAAAQDGGQAMDSPRWSYEIRAGVFEPKLDLFEVFYGDDRETHYGIGASARVKDWLEAGIEYGHMRARGVGVLTSSEQLGGSVRYQLNPVQIYANFIFQRRPLQRAVPYVGAGLAVARYEQNVDVQGDINGTSDLGYSARAGVRIRVATNHPDAGSDRSSRQYWRSFVFVEVADLATDWRDVELGGTTYHLGFRMEFDMP